jgi:uncharacterized protein YegL
MFMLPLTGVVGVALDFGNVALDKYALQNFVDAKATAAIREKADPAQKKITPELFLGKAGIGLQTTVGEAGGAIGLYDFVEGKYKGLAPLTERRVPAVPVTVAAFDVKLMFGPLFGVAKATLSAKAVAYSPKRHIVIVQDLSGSMTGTPLAQAKQSLQGFVNKLSSQQMPGDEVALVVFGSSAQEREPLGELKINLGNLQSDITAMQADLGGTDQASGINEAVKKFRPVFPQEVARLIMVVTDGVPSSFNGNFNSSKQPHIDAANAACAQGISVQSVFISGQGVGADAQQFTKDLACGTLEASMVGTPQQLEAMLTKLIQKVPARLVE